MFDFIYKLLVGLLDFKLLSYNLLDVSVLLAIYQSFNNLCRVDLGVVQYCHVNDCKLLFFTLEDVEFPAVLALILV